MSRLLTCQVPTCGVGRERTVLGMVRRGTLVVPRERIVRWDGCHWQVTCPECGTVRAFKGDLAREEPRAA